MVFWCPVQSTQCTGAILLEAALRIVASEQSSLFRAKSLCCHCGDFISKILGANLQQWRNNAFILVVIKHSPSGWIRVILTVSVVYSWFTLYEKLQFTKPLQPSEGSRTLKLLKIQHTASACGCRFVVLCVRIAMHHPDNDHLFSFLLSYSTLIGSPVSELLDQWCDWLRVYLLITIPSDLYSTSLSPFALLCCHAYKNQNGRWAWKQSMHPRPTTLHLP